MVLYTLLVCCTALHAVQSGPGKKIKNWATHVIIILICVCVHRVPVRLIVHSILLYYTRVIVHTVLKSSVLYN